MDIGKNENLILWLGKTYFQNPKIQISGGLSHLAKFLTVAKGFSSTHFHKIDLSTPRRKLSNVINVVAERSDELRSFVVHRQPSV